MESVNCHLLRTRERDSRLSSSSVRGTRSWVSVEVPGDIWFMVECAVAANADGTKLEVKRHITADFWEARDIYIRTAYEWARLCAYVRAPSIFTKGHTFEPVSEVSQVGSRERLLFRFESGLMLQVVGGNVSHETPLDVVRRVFPLN